MEPIENRLFHTVCIFFHLMSAWKRCDNWKIYLHYYIYDSYLLLNLHLQKLFNRIFIMKRKQAGEIEKQICMKKIQH